MIKSKKIPVWLTIEKQERGLFLGLILLYVVYILPILLANRHYQDDLARSLYGATGWNNDARPLGNVAPLSLLLSVPLLAYTVILYAKQYLPAPTQILPALNIGFCVIANPFFLYNLSYQFDSLTMVLALCAAILPYVIPPKKALYKIFLFSFILCMVTLTTYQPCCGVYISLWFLELFFMILSSHLDLPRLFIRAAACGLGAIVYKYGILNRLIRPSNGGWQPGAYQFSWKAEEGVFSAVLHNIQTAGVLFDEYLAGIPTAILCLTGALFLAGMVCMATRLFQTERPLYQKILAIGYLILLPFMMLFATLLPLLILKPSSLNISAHSLICLCSMGLWGGIMLSALYDRITPPPILWTLLFLPCLLFGFTFSYTHGNALNSQKQYEEYLTYSIVHDIETLNANGAYQALTVSGQAPRSPEVARLTEKYPLFAQLVPSYLTNSSYIGGAQLLFYTQEVYRFDPLTEEDEELIKNTAPILETGIYACYKTEDKIIIHFKQSPTK